MCNIALSQQCVACLHTDLPVRQMRSHIASLGTAFLAHNSIQHTVSAIIHIRHVLHCLLMHNHVLSDTNTCKHKLHTCTSSFTSCHLGVQKEVLGVYARDLAPPSLVANCAPFANSSHFMPRPTTLNNCLCCEGRVLLPLNVQYDRPCLKTMPRSCVFCKDSPCSGLTTLQPVYEILGQTTYALPEKSLFWNGKAAALRGTAWQNL